MFGKKRKSSLREKYETSRALAGLPRDQQRWVAAETEKRQKLVSARTLACSVCPAPATIVRVQVFPPSVSEAVGAEPGKVLVSVHQWCRVHDNAAGFEKLGQLDVELHNQRKESHVTTESGLNLIAFEK